MITLKPSEPAYPIPELDRETWARKVVDTLRTRVVIEREAGINEPHDVSYITSGTHMIVGMRTGSDESDDLYEVYDMKIERYVSFRV